MVQRSRTRSQVGRWLVGLCAAAIESVALAAGPPAEPPFENWRTSPFHRLISGATDKLIPCLCRHRDKSYRLGEIICLSTPAGSYFARCDLALNITTWVPTSEACTVSLLTAR